MIILKNEAADYVTLQKKIQTLTNELKGLKEDQSATSKNILSCLEELGVKNVKLEGLGCFFTSDKMFARMIDIDACFKAVRDLGAGDIIKETIHPSTLKSFVSERLKEGASSPEGVDVSFITTLGFRKDSSK